MAKIIVIGGGAAGLVASIKIAREKNEVIILEKNNKCGKKLLLTGNGKCNYWNENQDLNKYHSTDRDILAKIYNTKCKEVLPFFDSIGIVPKIINDYYYPFSLNAGSIVNALMSEIKNLPITIKYETEVIDIIKGKQFLIKTTKGDYTADKVILATGSKAYPKTGSTGQGYEFLKKFGHTINPVLPSLSSIRGKDSFYKDWAGVRSEVILSLYEDNKKIKEEHGEIQLTDYGISGICTFNLSGLVAKGLAHNKNEEILINFVPWFKKDKFEFIKWLDEKNHKLNNFNLAQILEGFLNYKIINLIFKLLKVPNDIKYDNVNKSKLVDLLFAFPFSIKEVNDFEHSQVCSGGLSLQEIDPNTLESLKVPGLFIIGEILDVDGDCGGYNLGFAWISALLVGEKVGKNA